jgi:SPP1 family predicted phage head-tail adaptor
MRSGLLRHRLTVRRSTTSDDGRGGQVVTWADVNTDRGAVEALGTREFLQAGALQNAMAHMVRMRYRSDLTVKDRIYWADRSVLLSIVSLRDPNGRGRELEVECVEVDS